MITIDARWLNVSGIGTYLRNLIPGILATLPEQHYTLIGNRDEISDIDIPAGTIVDVVEANAKMYSVAEQLELPKKIPKETKLFFATHYNIPLRYKGRMLVTVYDLFHLAMPHMVGGLHKKFYAKYMFGAVRRHADAILTISQFTKDELIRLTGEGKQPIYAIHLGVDESWFDVQPEVNPHRKPYFLFVGNIKPHKNLGALIKAFISLGDDIPHDLVLVGKKEGFITGDNVAIVEGVKLRGRVHFTGRVDDWALKQYMIHAQALVFPSLYEGFGLPALEAMALGCPVITSNVASLPEVCGDAALYCDPYEPADISKKIEFLAENSVLRNELSIKGIVRAKSFTWNTCIEKTCRVIDTMVS